MRIKVFVEKLILLIVWIKCGNSQQDEVFLVGNRFCVTNGSSAIVFNSEINNTHQGIYPSYVYPSATDSNDFSCDFDTKCNRKELWIHNTNWEVISSSKGPVNQYLTDERWEALPLIKTLYVDEPDRLLNYYRMNYSISNGFKFDISLSIRGKQDGHIFICEGTDEPSESNCYWIMLAAYDGEKSIIRNCLKNQIPALDRHFPDFPCNVSLNERKETNVLRENSWSHFRVVKENFTLSVLRNNEKFLEIQDENSFNPQNIWIHSKKCDMLWKIHRYNYLYSETNGNDPLGPPFTVPTDTLCITMFVALCDTCSLNFTLKYDTETLSEPIKSTKGRWKRKRFIRDIPQLRNKNIQMYPFRKNSRDDIKGFWALDDVRLCSPNEYRYIESTEADTPCQKIEIGGKGNILAVNKKAKIQSQGINCPEGSIGKYCIPCEIFGNNFCSKFEYCEIIDDQKRCHCSAGFTKDCKKSCPNGTYGHGCQKNCSRFCSDAGCHPETGFCENVTCKYDFTGKRCENPPEPFLEGPPNVYNVSYTQATVRMDSLKVIGSNEPNLKYSFQYIEDESQCGNSAECEWQTIEDPLVVGDGKGKDVVIVKLKSDTNYRIRAVIRGTDGREARNMQNEKKFIPSSKFKTQCRELNSGDIHIQQTNITARVTVKTIAHTCKLTNYNYTIGKSFKVLSEEFPIENLEPYKNYNFTIVKSGRNVSVPFKTYEGIPSVVRNFTYENSTNVLNISWTEPEHKYGHIKYKITWKFLHKIPCDIIANDEELSKNSDTTSTVLENLKVYSTYEIKIQAFTSAGYGVPLTETANTASSDELSEKERLLIKSTNTESTRVMVELKQLNCIDLEGLIYLKYGISCTNEWCSDPEFHNDTYESKTSHFRIKNLFPFTNYTVSLKTSRDRKVWMEMNSKEFQTKPDVPNKITDLQAYSKDEKSISLRWKPPYPPTGILDEYEINYENYYFGGYNWVYVNATGCKLWPDYHCADIITNIWKTYTYTIRIKAKNQQPAFSYGSWSEQISVKITDEAPEPPYGIEFDWKKTNDLSISWFHPNVTNGQILKFEIVSRQHEQQQNLGFHEIASKEDYQLEYSKTIPADKFSPCTKYNVSVFAHNSYSCSKYIPKEIVTPPAIPLDIPENKIQYESSNTSITVKLEFQNDELGNYEKVMYVVVCKGDETEDLVDIERDLEKGKTSNSTSSATVFRFNRTHQIFDFTIGQQLGNPTEDSNPPLEPNTTYCITLYLVNKCNDVVRLRQKQKTMKTQGESKKAEDLVSSGNNGLEALILLFLIPLAILAFWYWKRRNPSHGKIDEQERVDEIPLTERMNDIPPVRVNVVKPKKTLPTHVLPPLKTKYSKKIRLVDFEKYVKTAVEHGELESQHDLFPRGLLQKYERGSMIENKTKNRYRNLIAYDHTRVKLKDIPGDEFSDYINANYIDGYKKPRVYIATQGPKNSTLADFWRMIWQENVKNIVMLANIMENGKKKVEKYWPDINETIKYGGIRVKFVSQKVFANYDLRIFDIFYRTEKRQVEQMHFTTWPDHGVPLYPQSLVPFLQSMLKIPSNPHHPILIHCSAGVGRTGTIILCDISLRMAAGENAMDFLAHLEHLRDQRANMVDNLEQYKLAHLVVLECLFGMRTSIPCSKDMGELVEAVLENNGVAQQMRYLEEANWQDSAMETMLERNELIPNCPEKNRFEEIVPGSYRVILPCYPAHDPTSSYINAVLVDDFRNPGRYVVTQQPMPNTLGDFWRLVVDRNCSVVINLNKIYTKDKSSCKFWPTNNAAMNPVDFLVVRHVNTKRLECYEIVTVLVEIRNREKLSVDIVSLNNWKPGNLLPPNTEEFLSFREAADNISRNSEHVLITCYDGATACGLYLAMSFLIERMKLEQECDVCLAVRSIRHSRKEFVTTEEQYEYLFRTSLTFINGFQNYANFD